MKLNQFKELLDVISEAQKDAKRGPEEADLSVFVSGDSMRVVASYMGVKASTALVKAGFSLSINGDKAYIYEPSEDLPQEAIDLTEKYKDLYQKAIEIAATSDKKFHEAFAKRDSFSNPEHKDLYHSMEVEPAAREACAQSELVAELFGVSDERVNEDIAKVHSKSQEDGGPF